MPGIRLKIVASESLGVRSMCTYVETPDIRFLIDPGLALGPRFGLLPHPNEYRRRRLLRDELNRLSGKVEVMIITHYHYDHYTPGFTERVWIGSTPEQAATLYKDKTLLVKDYRNNVNPSQRKRGWLANRWMGKYARAIEVADGNSFFFGDTTIRVSRPVYHGEEGSGLGWVVMVEVLRGGESFLFASDVQGPISPITTDLILKESPSLLFIGGPPLYLKDYRITQSSLETALENLSKVVGGTSKIIVDHHLLRAKDWKMYLRPTYEKAHREGHLLYTAAEFSGSENLLLECGRENLYAEDPPDQDFMRWTRLPEGERRVTVPPI